MSIVRLKVSWLDNPKLIRAGVEGRGIHAVAMCAAERSENAGWFDRLILHREGATDDQIAAMVGLGLLEVEGDRVRPADWTPTLSPITGATKAIYRHRRWRIRYYLRATILERDGHRCLRCNATDRLEIDHIVPISRGGTDHPSNLQTLCRPCNASKGNRQ